MLREGPPDTVTLERCWKAEETRHHVSEAGLREFHTEDIASAERGTKSRAWPVPETSISSGW